MSKRLVRILPKDVPKVEIGIEISAVLSNGCTYFGKIDSTTADFIFLKDARSHLHQIRISNLYEIVYDVEKVKSVIPH